MKKALSIGLLGLLLWHILAYVLVCVGTWWQAEHDLSQRLQVYRSVDSIVEFQIPLKDKPDAKSIPHTTSDGFTYRGQYYSVVSMDIQSDTLFISGLQTVGEKASTPISTTVGAKNFLKQEREGWQVTPSEKLRHQKCNRSNPRMMPLNS
ncbi:hypothetical protein [Spirosoma jeollabukense]